jgi:hypothetical protein
MMNIQTPAMKYDRLIIHIAMDAMATGTIWYCTPTDMGMDNDG